ncbi:FHA domain containing protein [Novymonas esmeraldas]|uniref:FHA domain containing protein n=1 Tax=Novymonas esmeraldas TaxID=1808958 RepID=A0AAW0EVC7_9TRYP
MYILEVNHGGGEVHRHFLLPAQTYTLGRKECRILLPAAEPSISRHHATIVVSPMPRHSVLDPGAQLEVRIEDASKHGTFVDHERIGKDNTRFLYPEDRIRLGLRVTARIIPMLLVLAISPDLTDAHLDLVLDACVHIGAIVVEDTIPSPTSYYEQHTNCIGFLYVAEDAFTMEETMMAALGYGYTLVTPHYITGLVRALEEKDTLMPNEFPTPLSPSPAALALRSVHYRRPAQTFFSVAEFLSIGRPIVATVFHGYTFVLLDGALAEAYGGVLSRFGGVVESIAADAAATWHSRPPSAAAAPFPLTTVVLVSEGDFRSLSVDVMERGGGGGGAATTTAKQSRTVMSGYLMLYRRGVCLIPEENIHLALYRNDLRELNTKASACYLQRTAEAMLADTPATVQTADTAGRPSSGAVVGDATNFGSRRSSATRASESPASSMISSTPVIARRTRETSAGAGHSPLRAESSGAVATAAAPQTSSSATVGTSGVTRSRTNSRASSPYLPPPPPPQQQQQQLPPGPVTEVAPLAAPVNGRHHSSSASTPPAASVAAAAALVATGPVTSVVASSSTATTEEALATSTSTSAGAAAAAAAAPGASGPQPVQRRPINAARRHTHPFSLSARLRSTASEESGDDEDNGDDEVGEPEPQPVEDGSVDRRCSSAQTSARRASGSVRRASAGHSPPILPLRSEGVVWSRSRAASASQPATAAGGGTGSLARRQSVDAAEERPPLAPQHSGSEEPRRGSTALEEWRRRSSAAAVPLDDTTADGTAAPPTQATGTTTTTTTASAAAAPVLQSGGSSRAAQPSPALPPHRVERARGSAASRAGETSVQLPQPLSVRRGEQRLATSSTPVVRRASVLDGSSTDGGRATSPQAQSRSHTDRFTTPERDVVLHTASQVNKSPPRQRVEAVRIGSFSRDLETSVSRHADPAEDGGGSMGNRRSVVRRESVGSINRPPPSAGNGPALTRRLSSSFQRSDSAQLRELATPHRLMTPRVSTSVPRNRHAHAYGSVPRHRSPLASADAVTPNASVSDVGDSHGGGSASVQRGSIRRRRGSPSHSNGGGSFASTFAVPASNIAAPGASRGPRSSSVASAGGATSSATAESYQRMNEALCTHCQTFMGEFLDAFLGETEQTTRVVVRQTFMDATSKQALEDGARRIVEFLQYVNGTESDIPAVYSTGVTRAACHQVRQKSQYALSKMKACYKTVNCKVPSVLTRARAALSTRTVSPTSLPAGAAAAAAAAGVRGPSRRQSTA